MIMNIDKRVHPRFCPEGLLANVTVIPVEPDTTITFSGTVVDMSYCGIKIKLNTPILSKLPESKIRIHITRPETRIQMTINGIIKHMDQNTECGVQYTESEENELDDLMFECVRMAN